MYSQDADADSEEEDDSSDSEEDDDDDSDSGVEEDSNEVSDRLRASVQAALGEAAAPQISGSSEVYFS